MYVMIGTKIDTDAQTLKIVTCDAISQIGELHCGSFESV